MKLSFKNVPEMETLFSRQRRPFLPSAWYSRGGTAVSSLHLQTSPTWLNSIMVLKSSLEKSVVSVMLHFLNLMPAL